MSLENIYELIVAALPSLTSIVAIVVVALKIIKTVASTLSNIMTTFKELKEEVSVKTDATTAMQVAATTLEENKALQAEVKRLQSLVDKVHRE